MTRFHDAGDERRFFVKGDDVVGAIAVDDFGVLVAGAIDRSDQVRNFGVEGQLRGEMILHAQGRAEVVDGQWRDELFNRRPHRLGKDLQRDVVIEAAGGLDVDQNAAFGQRRLVAKGGG